MEQDLWRRYRELSPQVQDSAARSPWQALMGPPPLLLYGRGPVAYDCDGIAAYRRLPLAVVLPNEISGTAASLQI